MTEDDKAKFLEYCTLGDISHVESILENSKANVSFTSKIIPTAFYIASKYGQLDILQFLFKIVEMPLSALNYISESEASQTPLMAASRGNHSSCLSFLLECSHATIDQADDNGYTALMHAASTRSTDCVRLLLSLDARANPNLTDKTGATALSLAASVSNNEGCLALLLQYHSNINHTDELGMSPLARASQIGNLTAVKVLIYNADKDLMDTEGLSPLLHATIEGHIDCVQALLEAGAKVNQTDCKDWSPVMYAAVAGKTEILKLLLSFDANVQQTEENPHSPLIPALKGNVECMDLLLSNGANISDIDKDGLTVLMHAAIKGNTEMVTFLISKDADLNQRDKIGRTALMYASFSGKHDCVKVLLDSEADVNLLDESSRSAIIYASINGNIKCVKLLIDTRADVNQIDKRERSSLCHAAMKGNTSCVALLISSGATVNQLDKDNFTPLMHAILSKNEKSVRLLALAGGSINNNYLYQDTSVEDGYEVNFFENKLKLFRSEVRMDWLLDLILAYSEAGLREAFAAQMIQKIDENNRSLIHHALMNEKSEEEILKIVSAFKDGTVMKDKDGNLPYKLALDGKYSASVLWRLLEGVEESDIQSAEEVHMLHAALQVIQKEFQCIHVHLCGHGYAGKTTCRKALQYTLQYLNYVKFTFSGAPAEVEVKRNNDGTGKTEGMEIDCVKSPHHKWVIRDYGGQEDFHNNHARFLSFPSSVYVIVVALWDAEHNIQFSEDTIKARFIYWLKFLNSLSVDDRKHCIVVINFASRVNNVVNVVNLIKDITKNHHSIIFIGEPKVMNLNKTGEVRYLTGLMEEAARLIGTTFYPIFRYMSVIETVFANEISQETKKLMRKSDFVNAFCIPAMKTFSEFVNDEHIEFVSDKMISHLCSTGDIMIITASSASDPLIVLDINWIAKDLLGKLTNNISARDNFDFILTEEQIDNFTNNGSRYFGSVTEMVNFLEQIGACVSLKSDNVNDTIGRWFPVCGQRRHAVGTECVAWDNVKEMKYRKVVRKFKLQDSNKQMFLPGYFTALFLKILSIFPSNNTHPIKVYSDGMELVSYPRTGVRVQLIITVNENDCSFMVTVISVTDPVSRIVGQSECWNTFVKVRDIILNTDIVIERNDFMRSSPWFENLQLVELFVHPERETNVVDLTKMKSFGNELFCSFHYGWDGFHAVNEMEQRFSIYDTILNYGKRTSENIERVQQELQENQNILSNIDDYLSSGELEQSIITSSDKTNLHLTESIKSNNENNIELQKKMDAMKDSIEQLSEEVKSITDEKIQQAILNALDNSKSLNRINNMLLTLVKNIHDVPTMAIIVPSKNVLPDLFSSHFRLFFVCSHTLQIVPCGPKGNGYKFKRPKEWFKKVAPVVKVCLVIAKIALTISGIPIPINGVMETINQVVGVDDNLLNSAVDIMDFVGETVNALDNSNSDSSIKATSAENMDKYINSLKELLTESNTLEAYQSIKIFLDEVDGRRQHIGVEKVTSDSGITGWVRPEAKASFLEMKGEQCCLPVKELRESYKAIGDKKDNQSELGNKSKLWIPRSLFRK